MDNWVVIGSVLLGVAGIAVFFLMSQPAQAKSRGGSGGMKPRGAPPLNHTSWHLRLLSAWPPRR